jgi:hypothetical protein
MNICRNRLRATQQIWNPTSDDEYDIEDTSNFDPIPTATAVAYPNTPLDLALRHESPPVTNSDPTPHFAHQDDAINARQSFHVDLPDIEGDLDPVNFREWKQWSPPRRIAAIRRWVIHAIHRYGPVECWGEDLGREWNDVRKGDMLAVHYWLDGAKARVKMVRKALSYLECAMEGELSTGVQEWPDLYAQSHQLSGQLWGAILSTQSRLDCMILGHP